MKLPSYPKIFNLGHAAIKELLDDNVVISEKVDGSQISFMKDKEGVIHFKSHHCEIFPDNPGMFDKFIESVLEIENELNIGWTYRGEYLKAPHHNVLTYERVPNRHIYLFDINNGEESYLNSQEVINEAERLGFEAPNIYYIGPAKDISMAFLDELLDNTSKLGGTKVEGIVIKNYDKFGKDKHCLMGKYVRPDMKEKIGKGGNRRKSNKDIVQLIGSSLKTEARWNKAIQHLKEQNKLINEPKDIGLIIKEIQQDILDEEINYIKDELFKHFNRDIFKVTIAGFPEWYKQKLMVNQGI